MVNFLLSTFQMASWFFFRCLLFMILLSMMCQSAPQAIDELLRMATAQGSFHQSAGGASTTGTLDEAYAALGVTADASDSEVKKAYRKLMSQNHPDKLSARGVPEDMLKLATEKAQEIQAAYELIRKSRGTGRAG